MSDRTRVTRNNFSIEMKSLPAIARQHKMTMYTIGRKCSDETDRSAWDRDGRAWCWLWP
jgi:hypothetical protein